ncbi:molecular chaperone HtpG [Acetobacter sp.]|jgi:molecular chaperone HtpG|uniref:molecular chaperone HtpG n=1 Tax=Acetobacter sp. TaxID=440 RepID=UPI0025C4D185|nr:molecular chaperone HtpG [Acetobacter sp.]MCH4092287.1 molecular chaperone HtpG [Acetobacter sp.]MCI1299796.1 molecular chaperone HtpG [Acetobacter sp.]MCI1315814.1 molecular chaperone HtpG [Acetobacter sp.]
MTGQETKNPSSTAEKHEFSAEVGRLLDLVVHSLYSEREIFLRELVANAADATDRRRFEALTDGARALPEDAKIRINPDKDARLLTITDDGTGMTREELVSNLGTIARSGTRAFGKELESAKPEDKPNLIGQFGVGFYAAFMVADHVEVVSRRAGSDEAWKWTSDGKGSYELAPATREKPGTDITLHIKEDADEFLDSWRLQEIIRKWADHIAWPVTIVKDGEESPANEGTALWRKPKSEVTEDQYNEFYRHISHNFDTPWDTLHWRAEGTIEFNALLFIPGSRPFEFGDPARESKIRLHVKRMFITDDAALLPAWMRFVVGVVDTEDLPLNVSREMLQATPVLARIRKAVTGRVLNEIRKRSADNAEFLKFWENFGSIVKEGIWEDAEHRTELAGLARFRSSAVKADEENPETGWTTLADYISRMKPEQDAIYYLTGDNEDAVANSPQLEGFRARGLEVLLLSEPVDSFWPDRLTSFEGKTLKSVTQGAADLEKFAVEGEAATGEAADMDILLPALKEALGSEVSDVRGTDRLVSSAVVLAASENGPDLQLQKLMRRSGQKLPESAPVLELNPRNPLVLELARKAAEKSPVLADLARVLLDVARIQDGENPKDPAAFAQRLTGLLTVAAKGE